MPINELVDFRSKHGRLPSEAAIQPPRRFGLLAIVDGQVNSDIEMAKGDGYCINAVFFVLSPKAIDYIEGDETFWNDRSLRQLLMDDQLSV